MDWRYRFYGRLVLICFSGYLFQNSLRCFGLEHRFEFGFLDGQDGALQPRRGSRGLCRRFGVEIEGVDESDVLVLLAIGAGKLLVQLHCLERLGGFGLGLSYHRGGVLFLGLNFDGSRGEGTVLRALALEVGGLSLEVRGWPL